MNTVVIVAAHPDDEVLGCAGTIALHSKRGDAVHIVFLADGENSRVEASPQLSMRRTMAENAMRTLGARSVQFFDFPDNAMDSVPFLRIVQTLEQVLKPLQPHLVYTHFGHDLNIDHRLTYQAVLTACRPQPGQSVKAIYCFEVPSSTEWSPGASPAFQPNLYVDISSVLLQTQAALACYEKELRPWPHSRSAEAILARQRYRGSCVGVEAAESFMIEREIRTL